MQKNLEKLNSILFNKKIFFHLRIEFGYFNKSRQKLTFHYDLIKFKGKIILGSIFSYCLLGMGMMKIDTVIKKILI